MIIGVPKEIKNHEYRIGLTPAGVKELSVNGHEVIVENNGGASIGFDNEQYIAAGAKIIDNAAEIFATADMIIKVKEPQPIECKMLRPGQILFTYLHLAPDPEQTELLVASGATCIAYETVTAATGGLPLLAPMSEVAGRMSIQAGAHALEKTQGGLGALLGGVPGVAPAKVLIIGGGGREHALGWKVAQSTKTNTVYVAPGNAGTALEPKLQNVAIDVEAIDELVTFAKEKSIELTIVGPEVPLVLGVVDAFEAAGLKCFGPSKGAAQLEGSKAFTKDFLDRHKIPTAAYGNFTVIEEAVAYVKQQGAPIVIKADGLAAGKGVILAQTEAEAIDAIKDMLAGNKFGEAGSRVVVEEFLVGEEASFICMVDGKNVLPLATSQDHKARDNGDQGPNTGGMGAYSPAPVVTQEIHDRIMNEVIYPTVEGMANEGNTYTGFLYAGVMVAADGTPKVLEYNCRFGDPETQPIMLRLKSDLAELCLAALDKKLDSTTAEWDERASLGVVLAAGGYPESYNKGDTISGIPAESDGLKVFHAGTKDIDGNVTTNGGRVLCATALGYSVKEAQERAYSLVKQISWNNVYYRDDIGYRAVEREES